MLCLEHSAFSTSDLGHFLNSEFDLAAVNIAQLSFTSVRLVPVAFRAKDVDGGLGGYRA